MKLPAEFRIPATILIMIIVTILFLLIGGDLIGLSNQDISDLTTVIVPGGAVLIVAFWVMSMSEGTIMAGAGVIGVGLALVVTIYLMDQVNLIIPSTGVTASEIIMGVIVLFVAIGAAWTVSNR